MKLTVCACASREFIGLDKIACVIASARKAGIDVDVVEDLCELCEQKADAVHEVAQTTIVACHERALKSLLDFVGESECKCVDMRGGSLEDVLKTLGCEMADEASVAECKQELKAFEPKQGVDAWYPTLEKSKCIECKKCFDFCPFGVYEMVEEKVRVTNPSKCKNNCPSCARMCPVGAIIFPKYEKSPINGGEAIEETTALTDKAFGVALRERLEERKKQMRMLKK